MQRLSAEGQEMGARLGMYADLGGRSDDVKCSPNLISCTPLQHTLS